MTRSEHAARDLSARRIGITISLFAIVATLASGCGDRNQSKVIVFSTDKGSPASRESRGIRSVEPRHVHDLVCVGREPKREGVGTNPQDIYRTDDRGRRWRRLTDTPENEVDAIPSPTGRLIAFARHFGNGRLQGPWIYLMRADGSSLRRVGRGWPAAWSPSGTKLAYYRTKFDRARRGWVTSGLGVMTPDGSNARLLLAGSRDEQPVRWSPDGRRVLVLRTVEPETPLYRRTFIVIDVGHGARRVIARAEPGFAAAWSPDGLRILFDRFNYDPPVRNPGLYVMSAKGLERHRIYPSTEELEYAWSPRGPIGVHRGNGDFQLIDRDGTRRRTVATGIAPHGGPLVGWSDDGREVLFGRSDTQVIVINSDGSDRRTITLPRGLVGTCTNWLNSWP